jgi:hypothetical protein
LGTPACAIVDAALTRAPGIDEAVSSLSSCMQALSQRYTVAVKAHKGTVGVDGGRGQAVGILIQVPAEIQKGNSVLMDLSYSISEQRKGKLLGFPAGVWSGDLDGPLGLSAQGPSSIPAWLDRKSLRLDPKLTKIRMGGELHAILFDKDDNEVEFIVPGGQTAQTRTTATFVKADDEEAGPFAVESLEAGSPGALGDLASRVAVPAELEPGLRQAVQDLWGSLKALGTPGK